MTEYVVGVDHGGTKTKAVIADLTGTIHAVITLKKATEPSYDSLSVTIKAMRTAMEQLAIRPQQFVRCTVGFSGADWDFEYDSIRDALVQGTGIQPIRVINDCIGAMRGGTAQPYGGVVCIGTGLNIGLINRQGDCFVYGYLINPEDDGGAALGKGTIQAVRNAYAGTGPNTVLTERLLSYFRQEHGVPLHTVHDFLVADTTGSPTLPRLTYEPTELVPLLLQAAQEQDEVACGMLDAFCYRLSRYVGAAAERLAMTENPFELILSGGVVRTGTVIRRRLAAHIRERLPGVTVRLANYEPVCGCVLFSYDDCQQAEWVKSRFREQAVSSGLQLETQEETT